MMKLKYQLLSLFSAALLFAGCQEDSVIDVDTPSTPNELDVELENALVGASNGVGTDYYILPTSINVVPEDPNNPINSAKVELGKLLYHETGMATNPKKEEGRYTYSCASCHHANGGFQACLPQGISEGGVGFGMHGEGRYPNANYSIAQLDIQPIRTPSILNIAYQPNILWNGQFGATHLNEGTESQWHENSPKVWNHLGFEGTETQAIAGMNVHRLGMEEELFAQYEDMFVSAFGNLGDTLMSNVYVGLAMAAYERTVVASEAPFQKWLRGDRTAMNDKEKRGAIVFFTKGECYQCHNGPALSSMEFHALGMQDLDGPGVYSTNFVDQTINLGRGGFTGNADENYKFKVPQLYNLIQSRFYGHGASFHSVEEVIRYKNEAIPANQAVPESQLSDAFYPLELTDQEIEDMAAFIEYGLYDRELSRYVPESTLSGFCFPNNDYRSAQQMGCQ